MLLNPLLRIFISTFQLFMKGLKEWSLNWHLGQVRKKSWAKKPGSLVRFLGYMVRMTDGPNFYMQYKDEFIRKTESSFQDAAQDNSSRSDEVNKALAGMEYQRL